MIFLKPVIFFALVEKTNKNNDTRQGPSLSRIRITFFEKTPLGLRANYVTLSSLGVKSIFLILTISAIFPKSIRINFLMPQAMLLWVIVVSGKFVIF